MIHWFVGDTNGLPVEYYSIQNRVEREAGVMSDWSYIPNNNGGSKCILNWTNVRVMVFNTTFNNISVISWQLGWTLLLKSASQPCC
jgi:hypothetical protein